MKWLLGTCMARFNRRHQLCGHLFSGRYKALIVDGSGSGHLKAVCDYVHLNPARVRLLEPALEAREWQEADLAKRAKGDLDKVKIAGRLREETVVTVKWIAARLGMGRRVMCTTGCIVGARERWRERWRERA